MAEEGEQKNLPLFLTKLKQITENILWMSECLEMKARLQSDTYLSTRYWIKYLFPRGI